MGAAAERAIRRAQSMEWSASTAPASPDKDEEDEEDEDDDDDDDAPTARARPDSATTDATDAA